MPAVRAPAFLTAPPDAVAAEPWMVLRGADEVVLDDALPSFDPADTLNLRRRISFDPAAVASECGLEGPHQLGAAALWMSRLTGLRGATQVPIAGGERPTAVDLQLALAGGDLGGVLVLRTVVVLTDSGEGTSKLAARVPGSVLWEAEPRQTVDLEGIGTRFPTELRTFGTGNGFPSRAAWFLDWDRDDLSLPVLGSVRLYLNDAHPLMGRLASGATDAEIARIRETLKYEIARELITGSLSNREFLEDPSAYEVGTIGAAVRRLCTRVLFPYSSLDELAVRARTSPSRFAAELQSALQLYWEPLP